MQRQGQALCNYQGHQASSSHTQREAQLGSVSADYLVNTLPKGHAGSHDSIVRSDRSSTLMTVSAAMRPARSLAPASRDGLRRLDARTPLNYERQITLRACSPARTSIH